MPPRLRGAQQRRPLVRPTDFRSDLPPKNLCSDLPGTVRLRLRSAAANF